MARKRAVLVGCCYRSHKNAQLNGCVNDVMNSKEMLITFFGFVESDITVLIDTDPECLQPTGANIKEKIAEMVTWAEDGDSLFLHFSGHGTQVKDATGEEADGLDEAICPTDMNFITDDDLRELLKPLAHKAVKFTMVSDSCHSGSLLDQPPVHIIITGDKDPNASKEGVEKLTEDAELLAAMHGGGAGAGVGGGPVGVGENVAKGIEGEVIKSRALSQEDYIAVLAEAAGLDKVTDLNMALKAAFGNDAPMRTTEAARAMRAVQPITTGPFGERITRQRPFDETKVALKQGNITAISYKANSLVDAVRLSYGDWSTQVYGGKTNELYRITLDADEYVSSVTGRAGWYINKLIFITNKGKKIEMGGEGGLPFDATPGSGMRLAAVHGNANAFIEQMSFIWVPTEGEPSQVPSEAAVAVAPGQPEAVAASASKASMVLISGCMPDECSGDCTPGNDPSRAYGLLTGTIKRVIKAHTAANPGVPITNRALVTEVRRLLLKKKAAQNPCLECDALQADQPFILQA